MRKSQNFWDKNAGRYDRFMRKDAAAYERLYRLLRPVVRQKTVLELATATRLTARRIIRPYCCSTAPPTPTRTSSTILRRT